MAQAAARRGTSRRGTARSKGAPAEDGDPQSTAPLPRQSSEAGRTMRHSSSAARLRGKGQRRPDSGEDAPQAATRRKSRLLLEPAPEPEQVVWPLFAGPRPDEELLEAVRIEAAEGDQASVERIYELLRDGEDVNQRSALGLTCLAVAAAAGSAPLVSILLERRADATLLSTHRAELPLHLAARAGSRVVCQLLAGPTAVAGLIDAPNVTGWPCVHLAAITGNWNVLTVLVSHGASVNTRNMMLGGGTALHGAVRMGNVEVAESLLDREAEVAATDSLGRGALHFAAARADYSLVSLLLRSKADPLQTGPGGVSPLQLVPRDAAAYERVATLLAAYSRGPPPPFRTDDRYDIPDPRDLLPRDLLVF